MHSDNLKATTPTRRQGRPAFLDQPQIIRISLPGAQRERLRAERDRSGDTESEIMRQALEAELTRRGA